MENIFSEFHWILTFLSTQHYKWCLLRKWGKTYYSDVENWLWCVILGDSAPAQRELRGEEVFNGLFFLKGISTDTAEFKAKMKTIYKYDSSNKSNKGPINNLLK